MFCQTAWLLALLKIFQNKFTWQGLDTSFKFFTTITFAYIRKQIVLTFSTSTPMFETKRWESYPNCWLFPQCNRLRHTNIQGNCKCLYVRSTYQSATHTLLWRRFVSFLQFFVFCLLLPVVFMPFFVHQRLVHVWFERVIFKLIARSVFFF